LLAATARPFRVAMSPDQITGDSATNQIEGGTIPTNRAAHCACIIQRNKNDAAATYLGRGLSCTQSPKPKSRHFRGYPQTDIAAHSKIDANDPKATSAQLIFSIPLSFQVWS
jgi:hypothetical protein